MDLLKRRTIRGKKVYVIDIPASIAGKRVIRRAMGPTEALARIEANEVLRRHLSREPLFTESTPVLSVREFYEGKFTQLYIPKFKPSTGKRYAALARQFLLPSFGSTRLDAIDTESILRAASNLRARNVVTKGPMAFLRTILKAARSCGELKSLPEWPAGVIVHSKPLPDCPSEDEVAAYVRHAKEDGPTWFYQALVITIFTGLRMGELRALRVCDILFDTLLLHIRRALSEDVECATKSNAHRLVPIDEDGPLLPLLREAVDGKKPDDRIIVTSRGTTPRRTHILSTLKAMQERHGLRSRSWHQLRHYFVSRLCQKSVPLTAVMRLAGHSSIAVTNRYAHAADRDLRAAIKQLSQET